MRRPQEIAREGQAMGAIVQLTGAFEGIASMHIARIKNQVQQSEVFFDELWQIYTQLRVGKEFHSGRGQSGQTIIDKGLVIIVTSEGSLSGNIDQRLIESLLESYDPISQDIVVIGHHGATLLTQRGITYKNVYKLPEQDKNLDIEDIVKEVQGYRTTTVHYQSYVSLMIQEIKQIELNKEVQERGEKINKEEEYISDTNYIFEPSVAMVIDHMERSMLRVALNEVILASKLAQQASRFRAMSAAQTRAKESAEDLRMQLNYAKRSLKDERAREIINGLRKGLTV